MTIPTLESEAKRLNTGHSMRDVVMLLVILTLVTRLDGVGKFVVGEEPSLSM